MDANISLYEINRSIIDQQGPIEEALTSKCDLLKEFIINTNNKYYMLYGKEIGYFTLFVKDQNWEFETIDLAVIECLLNVGTIYSIEYTKTQDAIEIWVKTKEDEPILTCMYLFPYDNGIVKIGE